MAHVSKRIVAVVEHDYLPHVEEEWKKLNKKLISLSSFMEMPTKDNSDVMKRDTFLEFVEKEVILDVLIEPYIYKNFI